MPTALPCLCTLYRRGLQACHGRHAVTRQLASERLQNACVLAIGKAAVAMSRGLLDAARKRGETVSALLVITRDEAPLQGSETVGVVTGEVHVRYGDHPVPGARSLAAGAAAHDFVQHLPSGAELIVLLSGGASALCEHLRPGRRLADLQTATSAWLSEGLDIAAINRHRRQWSQLKAGGLRRAVPANVRVRQLLIADVPDADPTVVGSAPFLDETLPTDTQVIASATHFAAAIRHACADTLLHTGSLNGDAQHVAQNLLKNLPAPQTLGLWQGEATPLLPAGAGRGGRAQHLALLLALQAPLDYEFLIAATDGSDGNTDAAGVFLSPERIAAVQRHRDDAEHALAAADSHAFWQTHGGLLFTGSTGTNVMDVVLARRVARQYKVDASGVVLM